MSERIEIRLGAKSYEVLIGRQLIDRAPMYLPYRPRRVAIVSDSTVSELHGARLGSQFGKTDIDARTVVIPPGEEQKSFAGLERLCDALLALELERGDLIVAFGGGVVGDLAGFAAAVFKRGVDYVQIPTTLLAQVDSSVGGKTAIDTPRGKNLIGAFHQPRLVLADLSVLDSLPDREMRCGYAEVLKYGLLGDLGFFEWLEAHRGEVLARGEDALAVAIRRSVEMKAEIVAEDEREAGRRALLNLGHTFAHALEAETGFSESLKHGEAVGLGCALAFRFSAQLGLCPGQDAERAGRAIAAAGLPTKLGDVAAPPFAARALAAHMNQDKKAEGGSLTFILVRSIGDAFVAKAVDPDALSRFLISEGASP